MDSQTKTYNLRLRGRGQITIPRSVRQELNAREGDILTLVKIDDLMFLTQKNPRIPALTSQLSELMDEAGVSLADLLAGLPEERARILRERDRPDA